MAYSDLNLRAGAWVLITVQGAPNNSPAAYSSLTVSYLLRVLKRERLRLVTPLRYRLRSDSFVPEKFARSVMSHRIAAKITV